MNIKNVIEERKRNELLFPKKYGPDYAEVSMSFEINKAEHMVIKQWFESLKPEIMAIQGNQNPFQDGEPYYGAISGGISYHFTATSIGNILTVKESTTGKELNVTQELDWFFFG